MTTDYEYIVVGNGMFGSAAARYLSQESNEVAVIGPDEPENELTHDGVYASHYDERRLVRCIGRSKIRSEFGRMAMANYRMLEDMSGISFYEPVGYVMAYSNSVKGNSLESPLDIVNQLKIPHRLFREGDRSWKESFPEFEIPDTHWVIHEPDPAGMINPRAMLRAQNMIAVQQGTTIIREVAINIEEKNGFVQIETRSGQRYRAQKVLVTVGAFSNCFNLFPKKLPLQAETETFVLAQISRSEADRLHGMPAFAYAIDDPVIRDIYMAPPVRYADRKFYIKLGANTPADYNPNNLAEIGDWFRSGKSDKYLADFERVLREILPGVEFLSFETRRCILTRTKNRYPIIDQVTERSFVASGAHGSGAKSADTMGLMAAGLLIDGRWLEGIPRELFRIGT